MEITELWKRITENRKMSKWIFISGIVGMVLIMIPSFFPENDGEGECAEVGEGELFSQYVNDTEKRLEDFLESMEGVGDVKAMITFDCGEAYVYVKENKKSFSADKTDEEESYIMSGREKTPVLETVNCPKVRGVVIACEGADSPLVKESVYNTVSKVLGISLGSVYVTKLN